MAAGSRTQVLEAVRFIESRTERRPCAALITGTGLAESIPPISAGLSLTYEEIPGFPVTTVASHPGRLVIGAWQGKQILVLQGRLHLYEGYRPAEVAFPVRVAQEMGIRQLILTNAAGGLNLSFSPGDIMIIRDHINLTGASPLIGPNEDSWGERFPDMTAAYDRDLIRLAETAAEATGICLRRGVYAGLCGPSLETPAEAQFLRAIGADAVGFSTVQEVIAAVQGRMAVLGLSVITNLHDPQRPSVAAAAEIIALADRTAPKLRALIAGILGSL